MATTVLRECPTCGLWFRTTDELQDHRDRDHAPRRDPDPGPRGTMTLAVDPERGAGRALRVAAVLAAQAGMSLEVVAVPPLGLGRSVTEAYLTARTHDTRREGAPDAHPVVLPQGDVATELVAHLDEVGASLLCMDTRSRGPVSAVVLGSTSEAVVRRSPIPVALVGPRAAQPAGRYRSLVVAVDGSAPADAAVDAAVELAQTLDVPLHLVHVLDPGLALPDPDILESTYLSRGAARIARPVDHDVLHDRHPAAAIAAFAEDRPAPLIVMGTHGRSDLRRLAVGSVALGVVRAAAAPVVVVRGPVPPR